MDSSSLDITLQTPQKPTSKVKKKRRKSDFMCGRRSGRLSVKGSELCQDIPKALPPEERLFTLIHKCYQHTLNTVGKDFFPTEGISLTEFIVKGSDAFDDVHDELKKICTLAVSEEDSANARLMKEIDDYSKYYERLQKEASEWDVLLDTGRKDLEQLANMDVNELPSCSQHAEEPVAVNESDHLEKYLSIINGIHEMKQEFQNQVDVITHTSAMLTNHIKIAKNKVLFHGMNSYLPIEESPCTLLRKFNNKEDA